ncbi:MAG: nucleotidyltransferase domain-containing protein [Candidatus Rokubacteria bacterium]|nr:nucleotidyltransferase domain-containing protein [Candidatus Rokubacteria bacterium]
MATLGAALDRHPEVRFAYVFGGAGRRELRPLSDADVAVYLDDLVDPVQARLGLRVPRSHGRALSGRLEDATHRRADPPDRDRGMSRRREPRARRSRPARPVDVRGDVRDSRAGGPDVTGPRPCAGRDDRIRERHRPRVHAHRRGGRGPNSSGAPGGLSTVRDRGAALVAAE